MEKTRIDWCDSTWNPVTGCYNSCEYCYARGIAKRFGGWNYTPGSARVNVSDDKTYICPGSDYYGEVKETEYGIIADITYPFLNESRKCAYPFGFTPTLHRYRLNDYIDKKGRNIFVGSMTDLFGAWVPDSWIEEVFKASEAAPQHNYLFLTKNSDRYVELCLENMLPELKNMWYGTTVTNAKQLYTAEATLQELPYPAHTFLSIEPILEKLPDDLDITISNFTDWVIIGAETGRRNNKVVPKREWIEQIVEECRKYDIPIFMKSSLEEIWGEPLIQEFPAQLQKGGR